MVNSPNSSEQEIKKDNSIEKLKKHGGNIVTVVAIVLAAYFGWTYWQGKSTPLDAAASDKFVEIQNINDQLMMASQTTEKNEELLKVITETQTSL